MTDLLEIVAGKVRGCMPRSHTVRLPGENVDTPIKYMNLEDVPNVRHTDAVVDITAAEIAEADRLYEMELAGLRTQIVDESAATAHAVQDSLSSLNLLGEYTVQVVQPWLTQTSVNHRQI